MATKHFINPTSINPQLTFTPKSCGLLQYHKKKLPTVEVDDGIYISDRKSLNLPFSLLKRTKFCIRGFLS